MSIIEIEYGQSTHSLFYIASITQNYIIFFTLYYTKHLEKQRNLSNFSPYFSVFKSVFTKLTSKNALAWNILT